MRVIFYPRDFAPKSGARATSLQSHRRTAAPSISLAVDMPTIWLIPQPVPTRLVLFRFPKLLDVFRLLLWTSTAPAGVFLTDSIFQ